MTPTPPVAPTVRRGPKTILLTAALLAVSGAALAAQDVLPTMPMEQAVRKLGEAGYGEIRSLKADDGRWKGKAVKDGRPVSVTIDPQTGAVAEQVKRDKRDRRKSDRDEDDDD